MDREVPVAGTGQHEQGECGIAQGAIRGDHIARVPPDDCGDTGMVVQDLLQDEGAQGRRTHELAPGWTGRWVEFHSLFVKHRINPHANRHRAVGPGWVVDFSQ
ncbi:Clp family protein [Streptomyces sp. NBRC 110611]|nr:Clp family protein [Streptomyces sp. NBRC 110611]